MDSLKDLLTFKLEAGPIRLVVWEVLYVITLVLVLRAVLTRFLFRPVLAVLDERARRLDQAKGSQDDTLRQVEQRMREHAERLAGARREALARIEAAKAEAERVRKGEVDEARSRADQSLGAARERVAAAAAAAEADLKKRTAALAKGIASHLLGREVA